MRSYLWRRRANGARLGTQHTHEGRMQGVGHMHAAEACTQALRGAGVACRPRTAARDEDLEKCQHGKRGKNS